MKRKSLPNSLFLIALVFSLSSLVFVNVHASLTMPDRVCCSKDQLEHPQVKDGEDTEESDLQVPDVTVIGRVFELVQKFLPVGN